MRDRNGLHIWHVQAPGYSHHRAFDEVVQGLHASLARLGLNAPVVTGPTPGSGVPIVIGATLIAQNNQRIPLPPGSIIYNLEQVEIDSPWMTDSYLDLLRHNVVWDYSAVNIRSLYAAKIWNVSYVPLRHEAELQKIQEASEDIDVLFIGSLNDRRHNILRAISDRGCAITTAFDVYGGERDQLLARAKIILNVHFYEARVFEVVRVSYLLANKRFVVSETGVDTAVEAEFAGGVAFGPSEELPDLCAAYLEDAQERRRIAQVGQGLIRVNDSLDVLNSALAGWESGTFAPEVPRQSLTVNGRDKNPSRGHRGNPYYIVAPQSAKLDWDSAVLGQLARMLNAAGCRAWIVNVGMAASTDPFVDSDIPVPLLLESDARMHQSQGLTPIVVYSDASKGNPLNGAVVIRLSTLSPDVSAPSLPGSLAGETRFFLGEKSLDGSSARPVLLLPGADAAAQVQTPESGIRIEDLVLCWKAFGTGDRPANSSSWVQLDQPLPAPFMLNKLLARASLLLLGDMSPLLLQAIALGCPVAVTQGIEVPPGLFGEGSCLGTVSEWNGTWEECLSAAVQAAPRLERRLADANANTAASLNEFVAETQRASEGLPSDIRLDLVLPEPGHIAALMSVYEAGRSAAGGGTARLGKSSSRERSMYLDLLESCLLNTIYEDPAQDPWSGGTFDSAKRAEGLDWPSVAHTMIGEKRMRNVRFAVETVLAEGIEGDFIETGVWRGGACIYMKGILTAHGDDTRRVFVADSFEGLPPPDAQNYPADIDDPHHTYQQLAISLEEVQSNFSKYRLLDDRVVFLKGWFKDTLPIAPIDRLAVLRLDGDMYESTMDALSSLYDAVSPGGFVIVDDYALPPCRAAITDFRNSRSVGGPLQQIDRMAVYWRRDTSS
jgi:O-methyltransferase